MGKAKMLGQFKPYTPNAKADMRRKKPFPRNREGKPREAVCERIPEREQ